MEHILVDVDDCILKWSDHFKPFIKHEYGIHIEGYHPPETHFNDWIGVSNDKLDQMVNDFNRSCYFGCLPPFNESDRWLKAINKDFGYRFIAITKCSSHPVVRKLREINLCAVFGDVFDKIHCLDKNDSKAVIANLYDPTYLIDDLPKNLIDCSDTGHKLILLDQTHNQGFDHPEITRISGFNQLYQQIRDSLI